jgi:acetyl-CoA carboxylase carboxyl transferase subunit beta
VLASYASLGDVVLAEPGALMSFAGPRVVAQTTREKLPDDFGLAESNYRFGHLDAIVPLDSAPSSAAPTTFTNGRKTTTSPRAAGRPRAAASRHRI